MNKYSEIRISISYRRVASSARLCLCMRDAKPNRRAASQEGRKPSATLLAWEFAFDAFAWKFPASLFHVKHINAMPALWAASYLRVMAENAGNWRSLSGKYVESRAGRTATPWTNAQKFGADYLMPGSRLTFGYGRARQASTCRSGRWQPYLQCLCPPF